ncbi:MAG: anaerobic glycerol-3-phosphate dehydrogenase subunit GlpB [Candidatus Jordarchaeales archaeon]
MIEADVIVIGGGLAGILAATRAADEKLDVVVIEKGSGASYQSSGVIDIMGCPPGGGLVLNPIDGIAQTVECSPTHPYSVISSERDVVEAVREAVEYLSRMVSGREAEIRGDLNRNVVLLNTMGSFKVTCFYQLPMKGGVLEKLDGARLLVVGFEGLSSFNPNFCSLSFKHFASKLNVKIEKVVGVRLSFPSLREVNLTTVELARVMDGDEFKMELAEKLSGIVSESGASHVALPTLGLRRPQGNVEALEREIGVTMFELLSPPPSVPAQRLMSALERKAVEKGVRILRGYKAVGFEKEGGRVVNLKVKSGEKVFTAIAEAYILATGKFVGGGLVEEEDRIRETVFGLPLYDEKGEPLGKRKIAHLLSKEVFPAEGHPLMGCGVRVNAHMKPVMGDKTLYDNLFVAGSIISGYNYVREKSGMGVAAVTGYIAGEEAAMQAS